jgi:putative transposase
MRCVRLLGAVALAAVGELTGFVRMLRSRTSLVAENLFLRKQLAFYQDHKLRPQPLTDLARYTLVLWCRLFDWKSALVIVKPETLIGWHRKGFRLFWRGKSRPGRPSLPLEIRELSEKNFARALGDIRAQSCRCDRRL